MNVLVGVSSLVAAALGSAPGVRRLSGALFLSTLVRAGLTVYYSKLEYGMGDIIKSQGLGAVVAVLSLVGFLTGSKAPAASGGVARYLSGLAHLAAAAIFLSAFIPGSPLFKETLMPYLSDVACPPSGAPWAMSKLVASLGVGFHLTMVFFCLIFGGGRQIIIIDAALMIAIEMTFISHVTSSHRIIPVLFSTNPNIIGNLVVAGVFVLVFFLAIVSPAPIPASTSRTNSKAKLQ